MSIDRCLDGVRFKSDAERDSGTLGGLDHGPPGIQAVST